MVMRHQQNITFVEKAKALCAKTTPPRRRMCDRGRGHQLSESKNNDDPRRSALAPTSPKWCRGLDGSDMFINICIKMVPGLGRRQDFDDAEIDDVLRFLDQKIDTAETQNVRQGSRESVFRVQKAKQAWLRACMKKGAGAWTGATCS